MCDQAGLDTLTLWSAPEKTHNSKLNVQMYNSLFFLKLYIKMHSIPLLKKKN